VSVSNANLKPVEAATWCRRTEGGTKRRKSKDG